MRNLKLILAYDGSDFCGFAPQPGRRSVFSELKAAIEKLLKRKIKITGASRTDSGVHTLGQVISFKSKIRIPKSKLPLALNNLLPEDIRVMQVQLVGSKFNARFSAKSKEYEYLIYNGHIKPPHLKNLVWHLRPKLNLSRMRRAAQILKGRHDFSSFCASGHSHKNLVRTIYQITIKKKQLVLFGDRKIQVISLKFRGDGFLYRMVRNLVGTLVGVGMGKIDLTQLKNILKAKDRKLAGRTAPACGLCLIKVIY